MDRRPSGRQRPPLTPREEMNSVKRDALERLEAREAEPAANPDSREQELRERLAEYEAELEGLVADTNGEDGAVTIINAYRDADGNLRSRHGMLRAVRDDSED